MSCHHQSQSFRCLILRWACQCGEVNVGKSEGREVVKEEMGVGVRIDVWEGKAGDERGERSRGAGGVPAQEVLVLQTC